MSEPSSIHLPVLLGEVLQWINPQPGQVIVDGTLGGGGHTRAVAHRVGAQGKVVALDRDPAALQRAEQELAGWPILLAESDFCDLPEVLEQTDIARVDAVLLDLGLSSDQLADQQRGFSFSCDGPLDLRFNPEEGEPAARLVNRLMEKNLADLIYAYGEERHSRRIARAICLRRRTTPIETAQDLAEIVRRSVPRGKTPPRIHPATRTFQALRIAVNQELKSLEIAMQRLPDCLTAGGSLAVISFHSLEDRIVKNAMRNDPRLEPQTRRPITATEEEIDANPRARSAKMRVATRVGEK